MALASYSDLVRTPTPPTLPTMLLLDVNVLDCDFLLALPRWRFNASSNVANTTVLDWERLMTKQSIIAVLLVTVCMFSSSAWASDWCDVRVLKGSGETAANVDCAAEPKAYLDPQNEHRAQHCVPPLTWDEGLASQATAWARRCNFVHSSTSGVGENLYFQRPSMNDPKQGIDAWYGEVRAHKYDAPQYSSASGHFTQLIWKSTTRAGCGIAICPGLNGGGILMVCRYAPQGNMTMNGVWQGPTNVPRPCK